MKRKIVALLLLMSMALSLWAPATAAGTMPFSDVKPTSWYYTYVKELYEAGVINGMTDTTFCPQTPSTLAHALKLILLAAGYPEQSPTTPHWASGYYRLASEKGFLPASDKQLLLDEPITRLQMAEMIVKVLGLSRIRQTPSPFADTSDPYALILHDHGIFKGSDQGALLVFKPNDSITRAEISTVIWRVYHIEEVSPAPPDPGEPEDPDQEYILFWGQKVPVVKEIPVCPYDPDLFRKNENGVVTYESKQYTSQFGIDVSRYQGNIDWKQVKQAGVDFAIIRLGYRGYGSGALVMDPYFEKNITEARQAGIKVGVYFFSQAITAEEGAEEARYALDALKGRKLDYPIVFDWEPYDSSLNPRTEGLSDEILTQCAVAFCETVKEAGYQPMVYSNLSYFYLHFDLSKLTEYPFWLAQYNEKPSFYYHFDIWQYGELPVPGIQGNVDMNVQLVAKK
ncbi:MAG: GH25 family lysozyme [Evtepia sp.]|uniref:GH25 family lysozyme n=1 Tax=Evtepia sp. TaxID=2773933 RepID=UPI002A75DD66|nr:GH25 family lysozyme [Evtepia sp.]MDY3015200.1 GH25 family lysozyme [Evtepia sp.]